MPEASRQYKQVWHGVAWLTISGVLMSFVCVGMIVSIEGGGDMALIRISFGILTPVFIVSTLEGVFLCQANETGNILHMVVCMWVHTACVVLIIIASIVCASSGLVAVTGFLGSVPFVLFIMVPYVVMVQRIQELKGMIGNTNEGGAADQLIMQA